MSFKNFIPTVWAEGIERELERTHVFAEDTNRKYEGDIKDQGDSVKILGVGKPTITTTTEHDITLNEPEEVEDTSVIMQINQVATFNYKVGDIDKAQAKSNGIMDALSQETSEGLADVMDKYIANLSLRNEALKLDATAQTVTTDNILQMIDKALVKLYENDVKQNTRITITVDPMFHMIMKQAYTKLDTDNSEMLKNGRVGKYGNVIVKMSNNVAKKGDARLIQIKTDRAIAFAKPLTHVEPYRPEKKFADAVKGFILYDSKIVRPKEMINLNVKYN